MGAASIEPITFESDGHINGGEDFYNNMIEELKAGNEIKYIKDGVTLTINLDEILEAKADEIMDGAMHYEASH